MKFEMSRWGIILDFVYLLCMHVFIKVDTLFNTFGEFTSKYLYDVTWNRFALTSNIETETGITCVVNRLHLINQSTLQIIHESSTDVFFTLEIHALQELEFCIMHLKIFFFFTKVGLLTSIIEHNGENHIWINGCVLSRAL